MSTQITITGNIGQVDLRFTPGGKAVLNGSVAVNRRKFDRTMNEWKDVGTDWHNFVVWESKAELLAEHISKGTRVIVMGELESRDWETKDGQKRTAWEIKATEVGIIPNGSIPRAPKPIEQGQADPWASTPAADLPPF